MPTSRPVQTTKKLSEILDEYEEISCLSEEIAEWRDSLPDSLSGSDKYSTLDELANTLDEEARNLEAIGDAIHPILEKVPGVLDKEIQYHKHLMYKGYSEPRWVRLANAVAAYEAAFTFIKDSMESWPLEDSELDELRGNLDNSEDSISELESVEFPSMYG